MKFEYICNADYKWHNRFLFNYLPGAPFGALLTADANAIAIAFACSFPALAAAAALAKASANA